MQVEMHMVETSVQVFLRDGLILYRNICVIKYLAPILLSLAILHSKNVLKGGIYFGKLYSVDKLKYTFRSDYKQFGNVRSAVVA